MGHEPSELHLALIEAYPVYVAEVLHQREVQVDEVIADAIVEGTAVLDGLLTTFDRTPLLEQRTSPLELFREALRPVDHALDVVGIAPVKYQGRMSSLAWDRYDLSPGSSQVLGTAAHEAHMRWAITKAQHMGPLVTGPGIAVVAAEADALAIGEAVRSLGYRLVSEQPSIVIVDADAPGGREAVGRFANDDPRPSRIIAIAASPDDLSTMALKALGADMVVEAKRLRSSPEEFLPTIA